MLLDYPAGAMPIRDFKEEDLWGEMADSKPLGSWDKANRELCTLSIYISDSQYYADVK